MVSEASSAQREAALRPQYLEAALRRKLVIERGAQVHHEPLGVFQDGV